MSIEEYEEQPTGTGSADPSSLPLFTTPDAPRHGAGQGAARGRRRSAFTLNEARVRDGSGSASAQVRGSSDNVVPLQARDVRWAVERGWAPADLDWALVASLRQQTADRLSQEASPVGEEDREAQQERGRAIIVELLRREATEQLRAGGAAWDVARHDALARAVYDAVFGLGRLQPLVDDPDVENIMIFGHDRVFVELTGGRQVPAPAVAETDQELVDFLSFVASRSEVNARPFSPSHPSLDMRLDGGARLAAQAWVTPRPQANIRRHRLQEVSLGDLVELGMLTPLAASFLAAVIRSGRSVVVSGDQNAGKTTMVRGLCNEIPRNEVIGTFETEYELHLHQMPKRHPYVHAYEARPGSGEVGPDGRAAGEYTLEEALRSSFRMNLNRQIVGEVRGPEVEAMLTAMASGAGSISTTHARNAVGALGKLVQAVMKSGQHATHDYAKLALADSIDVIAHVTRHVQPLPDGTSQVTRFLSEIITVAPGEEYRGWATTHVFRADPGGMVARPHVLPDDYRDLARFGFDLAAYAAEQEKRGTP